MPSPIRYEQYEQALNVGWKLETRKDCSLLTVSKDHQAHCSARKHSFDVGFAFVAAFNWVPIWACVLALFNMTRARRLLRLVLKDCHSFATLDLPISRAIRGAQTHFEFGEAVGPGKYGLPPASRVSAHISKKC